MENAHNQSASLLEKLRRRIAKTGDSEPEQAIKIRLTIGIAVLMYFCLPWKPEESFVDSISDLSGLMAIAYYFFALSIVAAIIINPVKSPLRRLSGTVLDLVPLSVLMYLAGDETVFFFVAYLWVILGNGFRYGVNYLYFSLAISLAGFSIAILGGEYWNQPEHRPFGFSLLLVLILVPMYSAFLINKLHSAINTAKQANQAKSRFLANMSHELRTPLNGVIGVADLLSGTKLNREQYEFVNIMKNSANTLLSLIENVLDISKIEAGKIAISRDKFDLYELTKSIIQMQRPIGQSKGLSVSIYIDSNTPPLLIGDSQHLRQVLINIVGNAIKFTDEGEVKLKVLLTDSIKENQSWVRFEVIDTGIGISADHLDTIFEDFKQAPGVSRSTVSGTGLGTTISKELVHLMGGTIGVDSELGKGTLFWFELPFETLTDTVKLQDNNILVLSTQEVFTTVSTQLKQWGLDAKFEPNTIKALSELVKQADQGEGYDILMVEESALSSIDSLQLAKMLKSEADLSSLKLISIAEGGFHSETSETEQFFISQLLKPIDSRLLFNALHAAEGGMLNDENVVSLASRYELSAKKHLTALIAEDNHVNQRVLQGILKKAGVEVLIADNGEKAMDLFNQKFDEIDIAIIDMNMPDYSGLEVIKTLRFTEGEHHTPVILLTADATPEAREVSLDAGADAFLTKPVNSNAIIRQVAELTKHIPEHALTDTGTGTGSRTENQNRLFDKNKLEELINLDNDKEFIRTLIESFKADAKHHIESIKLAAGDDYLTFRESLHALKGSSTEMGAYRLAQLCAEGEKIAPSMINDEQTHTLSTEIEQTFSDTLKELIEALSDNDGTFAQL